jgi:hypothetical protein
MERRVKSDFWPRWVVSLLLADVLPNTVLSAVAKVIQI